MGTAQPLMSRPKRVDAIPWPAHGLHTDASCVWKALQARLEHQQPPLSTPHHYSLHTPQLYLISLLFLRFFGILGSNHFETLLKPF